MKKLADIDPEGKRLPVKLDSTSNGEFAPVPLWPANRAANRLAVRIRERSLGWAVASDVGCATTLRPRQPGFRNRSVRR